MIFGLDNWNLYPITGIRCAYKTAPAVTRRDGWCCLMVLGVCLANADGKGYRVGVFAGILNIVTGKFKGKLCTA